MDSHQRYPTSCALNNSTETTEQKESDRAADNMR